MNAKEYQAALKDLDYRIIKVTIQKYMLEYAHDILANGSKASTDKHTENATKEIYKELGL